MLQIQSAIYIICVYLCVCVHSFVYLLHLINLLYLFISFSLLFSSIYMQCHGVNEVALVSFSYILTTESESVGPRHTALGLLVGAYPARWAKPYHIPSRSPPGHRWENHGKTMGKHMNIILLDYYIIYIR